MGDQKEHLLTRALQNFRLRAKRPRLEFPIHGKLLVPVAGWFPCRTSASTSQKATSMLQAQQTVRLTQNCPYPPTPTPPPPRHTHTHTRGRRTTTAKHTCPPSICGCVCVCVCVCGRSEGGHAKAAWDTNWAPSRQVLRCVLDASKASKAPKASSDPKLFGEDPQTCSNRPPRLVYLTI